MKTLFMELLAGVLLCGMCISQDATPPPADNSTPSAQQQTPAQQQQTPENPAQSAQTVEQPRRIAPGSVIPVELTKTVDAKKAKTGDEVEAKVTQDLKAASGQVVVPKDTKVVGHVTEAQARTKDQKESELGIAFDHAVMKDGNVESLPMSIQAVIAPPGQRSQNDNSAGGSAASTASAPGAGLPSSGGRSSGMGGGAPQTAPGSYPPSSEQPTSNTGENSARQSITANTQGIVGIPNYELSTAGDATQGSIVRSEKGNVKLESGTLMLLRVNQ